jgi:hypothetical protein
VKTWQKIIYHTEMEGEGVGTQPTALHKYLEHFQNATKALERGFY